MGNKLDIVITIISSQMTMKLGKNINLHKLITMFDDFIVMLILKLKCDS